jgi:GT2 family glycosyltransferase
MSTAAAPRVSVIIPTRNRAHLVPRAIASVLEQTFADLEVLVVDDASTDDTAGAIAQLGDDRVRLIRRPQQGGVASARNDGIAAARAPYLAFLDDDDIWLPEKLARQVPVLDGGAEVVHSLIYVADAEGRILEEPSERGFRLFRAVAEAGYPYVWLLRRSSYQINTLVVRKDAAEAVGGFDPSLPTVEDLAFVHALWRRYPLHLVDEPLAKYCFHGGNSSQRTNPNVWEEFARRELAWIAANEPPDSSAAEAYLWMQIAQARWIAGRPGAALAPALAARRRDPTVLAPRAVQKWAAAAVIPSTMLRSARRAARQLRAAREPDPWLDLPTILH